LRDLELVMDLGEVTARGDEVINAAKLTSDGGWIPSLDRRERHAERIEASDAAGIPARRTAACVSALLQQCVQIWVESESGHGSSS
jgi:hypothetical protein